MSINNPTQADMNKVLASTVHAVIADELKHSLPGHCLRVSTLPEAVMRDLCVEFNANGQKADVVLLVGPHQQANEPWEVTATRLIELRNEEAKPLLAFIPPGLKAAAEDSFDVSTFVEINLDNVPARLRRQLYQRLPEFLQPLVDRVTSYLEKVERLINDDDIVRYYLSVLHNEPSLSVAGAAIYQLRLVPDFDLFEVQEQIEPRLDQNATALQTLIESNQPLLGRIHSLKLEANTLQTDLYNFLRRQSLNDVITWGALIATNPDYRHLAFDQWQFEGERPKEHVLLYLDELNLSPRDKDQPVGPDNPLYLDVRRANSVRVKWETNPKPAAVPDLAYFRIEIVDADGAITWESKNVRNTKSARTYRTKSIKVSEFRDQVEDGLYFFRMRAYSNTGEVLSAEDPDKYPAILRDPHNPEGKRINESDDVWFWVDENAPPPAEPQRNVTVNSFLEAQLNAQFAAFDRGDDPFAEKIMPRPDKTGWASTKGKPAEATYHIVYDAQARYTLPVSNLLRQIEHDTLAHPENLGRWRLNFRDGKTHQDAEPMLRQFRNGHQIPRGFLEARTQLFQELKTEHSDGLTATVDLTRYQDLILAYAEAYRDWLSQVQNNFQALAIRKENGRQRTDSLFLDIDTVEVLLSSSGSAADRVYLVAPTHPLRLLWHLQRALMAHSWIKIALETDQPSQLLSESMRQYLRRGLFPINLPPTLRVTREYHPEAVPHFYVEQGPLTLFWGMYIHEDVHDTRILRARTLQALGIKRQALASDEIGGIAPEVLTQKLMRYLIQHPYVYALKLNVFNPGDASLIVDAILQVEKLRNKDKLPTLRYELRLFANSKSLDDVGEAIEELLNPERQISPEADAFTVPGRNHLFPKLKFSRNSIEEFLQHPELFEANITVLYDLFPVSVEPKALGVGRSSFVYGLIQEQVTHFTGDHPYYAWQRQLLPTSCQELPVQTSSLNVKSGTYNSALLATILQQIGNLQASIAAGKGVEAFTPTLHLNLDLKDKGLLYQVHSISDWVFIIDRHLGLEYFDSDVGDDRTVYLLDFIPEFGGSDTERLLLTTRSTEEVTQLIRPALQERDLLIGDGIEIYFLQLLRSLSGHLALKLLSAPNAVREALGLAMARLFLEQYNLLTDRIVLPLDAHSAFFTQASQDASPEEDMSLKRGDLLLVSCHPETRTIHFHLIEVKWRTNLGDFNAYLAVRQEIETQLQQSEDTLRYHFDPDLRPIDRIDRQVKTKELISLLRFYLERSQRYALVSDEAVDRLSNFIENLDEGYRMSYAGVGLIFDFDYEGVTSQEEHAGLIFHRVGGDYVRRLLEKGLNRRNLLQAQAKEKPVTIEETEQQQAERQRIVHDTSMRDDASYQRVRSHFQIPGVIEPIGVLDEPEETSKPEGSKATTVEEKEPSAVIEKSPTSDQQPDIIEPKESPAIEEPVVEKPSEEEEGLNVVADEEVLVEEPVVETAVAPACDVLLGDTALTKQYGILGKAADKVIGLDLNGTNTISLFGVQGGGKSYTVGSIVEMATQAFPNVNLLPSSLATVIFHYHESQDYQPEFVSMIALNSAENEVKRLQQEYGVEPGKLDDVIILTSPGKLAERQAEFPEVRVEPLYFTSDELSFKDWRFLMGAVGNQMYMKQINMIMRDLRHELTLDALQAEIEESELSNAQKRTARVRLDIAGQFIRDSQLELDPTAGFTEIKQRLSDWLKPGRLIIVDLRDEFIDKDEALGLFVVMLNIFANAGRDAARPFNKLIVFDEAHKYMDNPELTSHIVDVIRQMRHQGVSVLIASQDPPSLPNAIIELSSVVILHRFNSPLWLKHVQRSITALTDLTPNQMATLRPGEAYVWANKATERIFTQKAVKVQFRPRVTQHGGGTKEAV